MQDAGVDAPLANASALDYYDYLEDWDGSAHNDGPMTYIGLVVLGLVIIGGGFCNLSTIVILIRRRLWLHNEGYIHLLALLVGNIVTIVIVHVPHWMTHFRKSSSHVSLVDNVVCKLWHYLAWVVFSTGWYVVVLLLWVCLRHRLNVDGSRSGLCRSLAERYCSLKGSKVVVGVISAAFAVLNLWQLYAVELFEMIFPGGFVDRYCVIGHGFYVFEFVSLCVVWFLPVLVVVPVLLVAILWTRRGTFSPGNANSPGGDGFSFRRMNDGEGSHQPGGDDGDFARATLLTGLAVTVLQSPIIAIHIRMSFANDYHAELAAAYGLAHILAATHLVVVPVLCLAAIGRLRKEIRSAAAAGRCCPERDGDEDGVNAVLPLDSIVQQ